MQPPPVQTRAIAPPAWVQRTIAPPVPIPGVANLPGDGKACPFCSRPMDKKMQFDGTRYVYVRWCAKCKQEIPG